MVASTLDVKKRAWFKTGDNQQRQEPNWAVVEKRLISETAPKNRDIIRDNALLILSCDLLYLNLADVC